MRRKSKVDNDSYLFYNFYGNESLCTMLYENHILKHQPIVREGFSSEFLDNFFLMKMIKLSLINFTCIFGPSGYYVSSCIVMGD